MTPENLRIIASSIACLLEHGFCSLVVYLYCLLACPWVRCSCGTESAFVFRFRHFSQRLDHKMEVCASMACEVMWGTFGCPFDLFFSDFGESVGCRVYPTCT